MAFVAKGPPPGHRRGPLECQLLAGVDLQEIKQSRPEAQARNARMRRQRLVLHLHRLGPSPLGHFIREVEVAAGADVTARLERYGEIDPEFVRALGGDRFAPSLHCVDEGGP
jgi:hypothetical protein